MFEKYKNKPKEIEAVQFTDQNKDQVYNSLTGQYCHDFEDGQPILKVTTIHGEIAIVRFNDYIVKEPKLGYYYPVKPEIFERDYYAK